MKDIHFTVDERGEYNTRIPASESEISIEDLQVQNANRPFVAHLKTGERE